MVAIVRLIERFSGLIGLIGAWVMLPLILSMVYEVLARHFFNAPTFWAYEVGYMLAGCLLYTSPSPRDLSTSRMPSSA